MRFAYQAIAKPLAALFKGQGPGALALRFGPDLFYSGMSATAWAPENATIGERAMLAGEDLAMGLGLSLGGQMIGRRAGIGRARANLRNAKTNGKYKSLDAQRALGQQSTGTIDAYTTGGDMIGGLGMSLLPRPVTQQVYEAAGARTEQTTEQVANTQREMLEEKQLNELLTQLAAGGLYAGGEALARSGVIPPAAGQITNGLGGWVS